MRTAIQFLFILVACFAVCWSLSFYTRSAPAVISGEIRDWKTGQPASHTDVELKEMNGSRIVARTDVHGRFSFQPSDPPRAYFLFAAPPHYGTLLQTTFGQTVVMYRKGERVRDIVIPAIPATELSGHVYGSDGKPISGCDVSALTRASRFDTSTNLLVQGVHRITAFDLAQADDPNKLLEVDGDKTDVDGLFVFHRLGADRYYVLARCRELPTQEKKVQFVWTPMLYPDVNSIVSAQQVLLLPGDHRAGIDFHLQRKRAYGLEGKLIFSDDSTPKPWPEAIYSQDLRVFRSSRALTSTSLAEEPCEINANAGTFRCHSLLPGEYTLYFELEAGLGAASNLSTQTAKVQYEVRDEPQQVFTVKLRDLPGDGWRDQMPSKGPRGILDFGRVCAIPADGRPAIQVLASGHGRAGGACYYMNFRGPTRLQLPEDEYTVRAFDASFMARGHSYLQNSSKFEDVLMRDGVHVKLNAGQTRAPLLPVLKTKELIEIAMTSLRTDR